LRVESLEGEVRIVVEDTGIGIEPSFLPHVFDRFRQADPSTTRQYGGLGLGLAIVDALARMHNGQVRAESDGVGRGARFTFTMPCLAGTSSVLEQESDAQQFEFPQPVLLVDDSPDTLDLLRALFAQYDCRVLAAESVPEALRLIAADPPGLIISDIGLPGVDGYEFIVRVRRLPGMDKVPAIAISGYAMEEDRQRALEAGFAAHIAKPIEPDRLFQLVQRLVKK
jgi:CheY-like chemotaxis protein